MKIALGQVNQVVGDIVNNRRKIVNCVRSAKKQNADLVIFPEFAMIGGYADDLLLNKDFTDKNYENIEIITTRSNLEDMCTLIGTVSNDKFENNMFINTGLQQFLIVVFVCRYVVRMRCLKIVANIVI